MPRAKWKGPFFDGYILNKILKVLETDGTQQKKAIKLWSRRSTIMPQFVGFKFEIHNGKDFVPLKVNEDMVGRKFGEFALTRKRPVHQIKVLSLATKKQSAAAK